MKRIVRFIKAWWYFRDIKEAWEDSVPVDKTTMEYIDSQLQKIADECDDMDDDMDDDVVDEDNVD